MRITISGAQFDVAAEPRDFWGWVAAGNYDKEWAVLDRFIRPEDTFIDLGAWVGSHSLYASTRARQVVAAEPDPVAFDVLLTNLKPLGVIPHRVAITGHVGMITLGSGFLGASTTRANPNAGSNIGPWEPGHQFDIECTTLRQFAQDLPDPLFIKMDIEGGEEQVLQDVLFFEERRPTLFLENHPFWWTNVDATLDNVRKISTFYKYTFNQRMDPVDLRSSTPSHVVFTDHL